MIHVWMIVLIVIAAVVLLVLFYPLSYRLDADLDERRGSLKAYWIFRLFRFRFIFDEDTELALSILFFNIDFLNGERAAGRKERRRKKDKKEEEAGEEKSTVQRIIGAAKRVIRVLSLMRDHSVLSEAMPPLRLFLFRSRPRDVHGRIGFGMSDPSQTGQITGAIAAMPFIYRTDLAVTPDFETEETYVKGDVHLKGHTLVIHVLILAVGILRNQNIRAFIGALRSRE